MTFEGEVFPNLYSARERILGGDDSYKYYNPKTGRPIKTSNAKNYDMVVLYSHNDRLGYKGLIMLKNVPTGRMVTREVFDQEGYSTFNDLWEVLVHQR